MNLGIGVMLNYLGGNEETVKAIKSSIGKKITNICIDESVEKLNITLDDNSILSIYDDGQSCCENRYMNCDDNFEDFIGDELRDFELKEIDIKEDEWEDHEIKFLDVITNKGRFQIANHNEHNGYYGGFAIVAKLTKK
jgi:hypothetical protein